MPARKSSPKPKKTAAKPKASPHGPSEGKGKPAKGQARSTPAKKAPAKKAAPARRPGGAAASGPENSQPANSQQPTSVAQQLLQRRGALDAPAREKPPTPLEEAFITEYMRNGMNGTAAWRFVHPGVGPVAAASAAYACLRKPQIAARVEQERRRLAQKHELTREQLLAEFLAIARADPNELVQMRAVACSSCWAGEVKGGHWVEPDPDCAECMGEGHTVPWIADTRKLSPEARALYAGIQQTKEGIKVLMHDKVAALTQAGRIIGAFERDNEQKSKGTAEALREFFGALHSATAAGLPIVAPADLPRQQRDPLVKG